MIETLLTLAARQKQITGAVPVDTQARLAAEGYLLTNLDTDTRRIIAAELEN